MKKTRVFLLLALLTSTVAVNARNRSHPPHYTKPPRTHNNGNHNGGVCNVATPLDGGLLSVLGAGGIVYFLARKKRKNKQL
jgi:hypothetical protein